ncbi:MAG: RNA polymerase sigma factor [Gemmataceae bacterium]
MAGGKLNQVMQQLRGLLGAAATSGTDRELLERFTAQRDQQAFAALVDRHGAMVLSTCRRILQDVHDADDAFQATFLVLAQKAGAIGWQDSVAGWLHAVACRIARKQRSVRARKLSQERQVAEMTGMPADDLRVHELRPVLDEELERLPEKYRTALVLCYLEGKSGAEAAGLLGCSEAGVWTRLSRGRELLRKRLSRRGLVLSVTALATAISAQAIAAPAPALADRTVQAALQVSAGLPADALVTGQAFQLMKGALHTMWVDRMKRIAVSLLVPVFVGLGLGLWWHQGLGIPDREAAAVPVPAPVRKSVGEIHLVSVYLDTPIGRGRQITLSGKLDGAATLVLDGNLRKKQGKGYLLTQVDYPPIDVELKEVKLPDAQGRRLFDIVGAPIALRLVVPAQPAEPYRLLELTEGRVTRVLTLEPVGVAGQEPGPDVAVQTCYLAELTRKHRISIEGKLGGAASLRFDPNQCNLGIFGETGECSQIKAASHKVTLKRQAEGLYEVVGAPEAMRLLLPGKQTATGRLQWLDADGLVAREVSLEAR